MTMSSMDSMQKLALSIGHTMLLILHPNSLMITPCSLTAAYEYDVNRTHEPVRIEPTIYRPRCVIVNCSVAVRSAQIPDDSRIVGAS